MGGCCCHVESPGCKSGEERSGLLSDNSKASTQEAKLLLGTCGPEGDGDIRNKHDNNVEVREDVKAVEPKNSPEVREIMNGPQKVLAPTPPPRKIPENPHAAPAANSTADAAHANLPQCTLILPEKPLSSTHFSAVEAEAASSAAADGLPDISALLAQAVCAENPAEINTMQHANLAAPDDDGDEAEARGQAPGITDVLSQPNTQLPPVEVGQEGGEISLSCAATEPPQTELASAYKLPGPPSEEVTSCDITESSSKLKPGRLDHNGEEGDSGDVVVPPEIAAPEEGGRESLESEQDVKPDLTSPSENMGQEEMILKGQDKDGDVDKSEEEEEVKNVLAESRIQTGDDAEIPEVTGEEEWPAGSSVNGADGPVLPEEGAEDDPRSSEEDLYRGAEELTASQDNGAGFLPPLLNVEDRCSLAPAMDILSYSEREWRGNTAKSALIRKGYTEMSSRFSSLRRVRGDNYCALRATLFQVFTHSTQLPSWLQDEDVAMLPDQLEAQEGLISGWSFPGECLQGDGRGDAILQMKGYTKLLRAKWQAAVDCPSVAERQRLCERLFQGGEEELGLLEALKLLMLARALELHGRMQAEGDVPLFCWLLFARDSSDCPRSFLSNHLSHVGLSAGLEQVEMFLLGYTLECTIQVYRLYKADTEEFVTFYPDDHRDDWPSVCLVTEDDRHYNVPIVEAVERAELDSS
ncbi:uncharacterized protein [Takifugu rubripes]|uniref:Uncharacterized LOC101065898 n=1 Tax=Takifugu rubripes TaxID=31033 RepID=A0A674MNR3_TAKRU|nr:uncharacterized protein LOC101065898 [Takifugu rubripes]XP_029698364.1 uncharacterized protein LOC101065898 [Takifugu rubripes]